MENTKLKIWAFFNADNTPLLASPIKEMAQSWLDMLRGVSAFGIKPDDQLELVEGTEDDPRIDECFRQFREMGGARFQKDFPVVFNDGRFVVLTVSSDDGEPNWPVWEGDKMYFNLRPLDILFCGYDIFGDCMVEVDLNAKTISGLGVRKLCGKVTEYAVSL